MSTTARKSFVVCDSGDWKFIDGDRSTHSHTVCEASHSRSRT